MSNANIVAALKSRADDLGAAPNLQVLLRQAADALAASDERIAALEEWHSTVTKAYDGKVAALKAEVAALQSLQFRQRACRRNPRARQGGEMHFPEKFDQQDLDDEETILELTHRTFQLFKDNLELLNKLGGSRRTHDWIEDTLLGLKDLEPNWADWKEAITDVREKSR